MKDTHSLAAPRPLRIAHLLWPACWVLAFAAAITLLQRHPPAAGSLGELWQRLAETGAWLAGVWLSIRLMDVVVWDRWVPQWLGVRTPGLLRQFVAVLLFVLTLAVVLSRTWGLAVSAVLATTGVLGIVLGLALRNILADFFSGIALNIEKPFDLGDFILLRVRSQRDPFAGTVREINWRSTRLLTPEDNLVSVPNSVVAGSIVENLSYPSPVSEQEQDITLDWDVPLGRAERVLTAAATEAWALGATAGEKPPKLRMWRMDGQGVAWRVVYLLDPRLRGKGAARHTLLACMHRHLRVVGLRPAVPPAVPGMAAAGSGSNLREHERADHRALILGDVPLLRSLSASERERLADGLVVRNLAGDAIAVRAGEPGQSMFVVAEGTLDVRLGGDADAPRVNVLGPGSVFGEMGLFTGDPRSATVRTLCPAVLYEIDRQLLLPLMAQRASMVDELSEAVAQYQARDQRTLLQALSDDAAPAAPGVVRQLTARLRAWLAGAEGL